MLKRLIILCLRRNYAGALYRDGKTVKAFDELGLDPLLLQNVRRCGFKKPTLIQSEAIPKVTNCQRLRNIRFQSARKKTSSRRSHAFYFSQGHCWG